jgi:predicted phosphodiesterase
MPDSSEYQGVLVIGDPHLEGRQPGFRKDDYPTVILEKLAWCLRYAREHRLLPAILGDLFDKPRDNPTWIICRLVELFDGEIIGLYGNHDCADPVLGDHDSLSVLVKARRLRLVTEANPWRGTMNGRAVVVGGSSYRNAIPMRFEPGDVNNPASAFVIWLTHHDVLIPGYEDGRITPREIPGIDLVVNGHIHRRLEDVRTGRTVWINPGNISRRARADATREHVPSALRIVITERGCDQSYIDVPHRPFDEVFHEAIPDVLVDTRRSEFVTGLAELQARRTTSGVGLMEFLDANLEQFEPAVASEIQCLSREVLDDESVTNR